jgi:heme-degrading monooxygenase HmoA
MTVLVRISATGMDQATYDQMAPVLHPLLKKQPGFIMHVAYPTPGGFNVGEVWESQAQQESWFNEHVKPNLPAELLDAMSTEHFQLHAVVQP